MLAWDNENFRTPGENWTHDPPNATCLSDVPTTEPEGREFDSCPGNGNFLCPGRQNHWERWSRFYLPGGHPYLWSRARRVMQPQPRVYNMIQEELALVKQNGARKPRRKKGWSGLFYPPNGLNFQFCCFNLIFWLLWVDPSPIILYFIFLFDPSWSESILVDPTLTGGPSWSGPSFVPACPEGNRVYATQKLSIPKDCILSITVFHVAVVLTKRRRERRRSTWVYLLSAMFL